MKTIFSLLFSLVAASLFGATPSYKSFIGAGGITITSNPPNGAITIDGSGISAGALPTYAITNEWAGPAFTNKVALRQEGASELVDSLLATNGNISFLNDGFAMTIGNENGVSVLTNHASWFQSGADFRLDVGSRMFVSSGSEIELESGGGLQVLSGGYIDLDQLLTNAFLRVGAGGILTTGLIGSGLSLSPDGTLSATAGGGDVTKVGTPVNNQVAVWTGDGTIEGVTSFVYNGETLELNGASTPGLRIVRTSIGTNHLFADSAIVYGTSFDWTVGGVASVTFNNTGLIPGSLNRFLGSPSAPWGSNHVNWLFPNTGIHFPGGGFAASRLVRVNSSTNLVTTGITVTDSDDLNTPGAVITPRLQVGSISNITVTVGDNLHVNGSNYLHRYVPSTNATLVFTNLALNTPVRLRIETTNDTAGWALTFSGLQPQSWGSNGVPVIQTNGGWTEIEAVRTSNTETNAKVLSGPLFELRAGRNLQIDANYNNLTKDIRMSDDITVEDIVVTNSIAFVNNTVAGVGGANTNFTFLAERAVTYVNAGLTNVNIVAVMPGVSGLTYFPTIILSNLTTTSRELSWSTVTNHLINLQQYDGVTLPITISNKHTAVLTTMLNGTNAYWALKQATNGF